MRAPARVERLSRRSWIAVGAACAAVAAASLAVPATLGYDPWAWLVWGREIGRGSLDTTGGPSWKPLPVAATTLLAPLGELAVPAYLLVARTAALLALAAVVALAVRLGGRVAGAAAAVALLLAPDGDPRLVRLVLEGHEAPWSAGLAVAALGAQLAGRPRRALLALWLLCLLRPEAWPFLLALVLDGTPRARARRSVRWWSGVERRDRSPDAVLPRGWAVAAVASIPLLWFVPDWIGSGSPLHGADAAQVLSHVSAWRRLGDALVAMATMVPVPAWVLAAVAVVEAPRRRRGPAPLLAASALAWSALVVGMAFAGGYAAISRFFLPAAAVLCVLAGVGAAEALDTVRGWTRRRVRLVALPLGVAAVALVAPRLAGIPDVVDEVRRRGHLEADLDVAIAAAGGPDVLTRCGDVAVTGSTLLRSAVAWKLDVPLRAARLEPRDGTGTALVRAGRAEARALVAPGTVELARSDRWVAVAVRCPGAVRSAGGG